MSRYTGPACRLCRREGTKLFLKGDRCLTNKCALDRRATAPGQHGAARKKVEEYGLQLREKQKAKRYYGVPEKQFANYFEKANNQEGMAGENLLSLLERRFDNAVYKMGMANSRKEARQFIAHGHFLLNGKKATIPSILLKTGDVISVREKTRSMPKFKELIETLDSVSTPKWLDLDKQNAVAKVVAIPGRDDVDFPFEEHLIVELYSK